MHSGLSQDERKWIADICAASTMKPVEETVIPIQLAAVQLRVLNDIRFELDSIGRALERIAGRM